MSAKNELPDPVGSSRLLGESFCLTRGGVIRHHERVVWRSLTFPFQRNFRRASGVSSFVFPKDKVWSTCLMSERTFTAVIRQEEVLFVAECPEVGTVSQGSTMEEAVANLKEATELYLEEFWPL
jgi:hypothetical protein